ncbi:uncharacterized protein F5147DRAFT_585157, partial [Suillus discolor]
MARPGDAQDVMAFINALRQSSLDDIHSQLSPDTLDRLRNPPHALPDTTDPNLIQSLKIYFADTTIKQYNSIRDATIERYPDDDIYSYYCVKQAVAELSGVVLIINDIRNMCINTCLAFTGPYADLDHCSRC